jgi:hypothetical protein
LVSDLVWQLCPIEFHELEIKGIVWSHTITDKVDFARTCPLDPDHVTGMEVASLTLELNGGSVLCDTIPNADFGPTILTSGLARNLNRSGLTGFTTTPNVHIGCNQTAHQLDQLYLLNITARAGVDRRWKFRNGDNSCPHCRRAPIVCPSCGEFNRICPVCQVKHFAPDENAPNKHRVTFEEFPPSVKVVDYSQWDGSDFFHVSKGGDYISKRAYEWLMNNGVRPLNIQPALLNYD